MELALHHPEHGAYGSGRLQVGPRGDFATSPSLGPDFAALLAPQIAQWLQQQPVDQPLALVEAGPGEGDLAWDLAQELAVGWPELAARTTLLLIEPNAGMAERQRLRLRHCSLPCQWLSVAELAAQPKEEADPRGHRPVHGDRLQSGQAPLHGVRVLPSELSIIALAVDAALTRCICDAGIDMSPLFSEMIMATATRDLVQKKMCYLYLSNYASLQSEMALLVINTLQKDARDEDPMVRGLALRCLCSLHVENVLEYLVDPVLKGLRDVSPYGESKVGGKVPGGLGVSFLS